MSSMRKMWLILLLVLLFAAPVMANETLTWDDCLREAALNHPDLIAAQETVYQSKSSRAIAASAFFPQLSLSASLSTAQSALTGNSRSSSGGISGSQLIFDGFKTSNSTQAASENIRVARESFRFTSAQVRLRLRGAFIDLLRAQALNELAQEIYKIRRNNLQLISLRYEAGTEHRGALLTAQANLASAEFEIHQAERAVLVAQQSMTKELGRKIFSPLHVKGELSVDENIAAKPDLGSLADQHPSLLKAVAKKNAAAYDVRSSRGSFSPTLSVEGGASRSGNGWPPRINESDAAVRLSVPLFEGGLNTAQLAKSKSVYRELEAAERSAKDGILMNLEKTWNNLQDTVEKIGIQQKILAATEERSKIAEAQYAVGLIAFDNWTIIEDDLVRQKKSFLDAQVGAMRAQADWIEAKGETLEYEK